MFWIIINREILEHLASAKFALLTVLCLALVFLSAYVSTKDYELRQTEYQNTIQLLKEKGQPRDAWKAFRKPEVMSIFSQGLDKRLGNMSDVHSLSLKLTGYLGPYERRSGKHLSGFSAIDFTFVVRMVLSLLAIFLAYDVVSGEREAGTLKLTLSYSVKRSILLLGKFSGGIICLLIPLAISFIIGLLVVQFSPLVELQAEECLRVFLIFLVSALYLAAFFALGILVSCRTQNSATTLLILLILWMDLLVIVPNASTALVKKFKIEIDGKTVTLSVQPPQLKGDMNDAPVFKEKEPSIISSLSEGITNILILFLWNVVFLLLAHIAFMRYDVR